MKFLKKFKNKIPSAKSRWDFFIGAFEITAEKRL